MQPRWLTRYEDRAAACMSHVSWFGDLRDLLVTKITPPVSRAKFKIKTFSLNLNFLRLCWPGLFFRSWALYNLMTHWPRIRTTSCIRHIFLQSRNFSRVSILELEPKPICDREREGRNPTHNRPPVVGALNILRILYFHSHIQVWKCSELCRAWGV